MKRIVAAFIYSKRNHDPALFSLPFKAAAERGQ